MGSPCKISFFTGCDGSKNHPVQKQAEPTQETEVTEPEVAEPEVAEPEVAEIEDPEVNLGARRKRKKPTKPKKAKKAKKAVKKAKGAALLSCLVPLQLVCHLPDGLGPVVVFENDLCNSALGGEFSRNLLGSSIFPNCLFFQCSRSGYDA